MRLLAAVLSACLITACAYESPTGPPLVVIRQPVPATITASVTYGSGNGAGRAFLVVQVADAAGHGIAVPVTITVGNGTIAAGSSLFGTPVDTSVTITSDAILGQLQVTIVAHGTVVATLTAGSVSTTVALNFP